MERGDTKGGSLWGSGVWAVDFDDTVVRILTIELVLLVVLCVLFSKLWKGHDMLEATVKKEKLKEG